MVKRRHFLCGSGALVGGLAVGLLRPVRALAAWSAKAFEATDFATAFDARYDGRQAKPSETVVLKAPEIAENGSAVPIQVSTTLDGVESISLFVKDNPLPLTAIFNFPKGTLPEVSTRIRLAKTGTVMAVVKAPSGLHSASQEVKVTIGGCGG